MLGGWRKGHLDLFRAPDPDPAVGASGLVLPCSVRRLGVARPCRRGFDGVGSPLSRDAVHEPQHLAGHRDDDGSRPCFI
jgi:hypothetical protein